MLKRVVMLPLSLVAAGGLPFFAMNKDFTSRFQSAMQSFSTVEPGTERSAVALGDEPQGAIPSPFARGLPASSAACLLYTSPSPRD